MENGLLDHYPFSYDRENGGQGNRISRYRPAQRLQALFSKLTVTLFDINHHDSEEMVILSDFETDEAGEFIKTKRGKKKRELIDYEDSDHPSIAPMRNDLETYNDLLLRTHIDISSLDQPYIERQINNSFDTQRIPINQSTKFVRRIFSRSSWHLNGRFYGGWWQQVSEDYRRDIRIDGSPTVEVDFKGYHVSMLAQEQGVSKPLSYDWYDLGEVLIPKLDKISQRKAVKLLMLTAINARD